MDQSEPCYFWHSMLLIVVLFQKEILHTWPCFFIGLVIKAQKRHSADSKCHIVPSGPTQGLSTMCW